MRTLFCLFVLSLSLSATAQELQYNDLYTAVVDNDLDAQDPDMWKRDPLQAIDGLIRVDARGIFFTMEEVLANLSPYLESKFETFILVNTANSGSQTDLVPYQHMRVLHRKQADQTVFVRNANGMITDINFTNVETLSELPDLVPVSTGKPGDGGIRTFSGIFRFNMDRTRAGAGSKGKELPMSFPSYVLLKYKGGRNSGVAVHGTPTRNHKLLGVQRASHGCVRTFPAYAKIINTHILSDDMQSTELPQFGTFDNLPNADVQSGNVDLTKGSKTLLLLFNGTAGNTQDI